MHEQSGLRYLLYSSSLRSVDKCIGKQADKQLPEASGETSFEWQGVHAQHPRHGIFHTEQNSHMQFA